MQNSIKFLGRSSAIYFVGAALSRSIGFFLLPLYTKYLSPIDYGYFDLSCTYLSLVASIIFFEIHNGILRYILKSAETHNKYAYISNGLVIYLFSCFIYTVIAIGIWKFHPIKNLGIIYCMGLFDNLAAIVLASSRGLSNTLKYALAGIIGAFSVAILNIVLIVIVGLGYKSLYYAQITSACIQILFLHITTGFFRKLHISDIDKQKVKQLLIWAVPLSLNSFAYWGMTGYNKIVVERNLGLDFNGLYAIAIKFSTILNLIVNCFLLAWQELAFIQGKGHRHFYSNAINNYIRIIGLGVILLIPFIAIVFPVFVNVQYAGARNYIPLALIGVVVSSISSFLGTIYGALEKTNSITYTTIIGCCANIFFVNTLIARFGLNGVNISLILSFAICIMSRIVLLKRHIELSIKFWTVIKLIAAIILSYFVYDHFGIIGNVVYFFIVSLIALISNKKLIMELYATFRNKQ